MPVGSNILAGASGQSDTGYDIDQSLRFNDDDGTYLSKAAPGAAGNLNNWTVSVWLKRGQTTGLLAGSWEYQFFGQGDVSANPVSSMSFYDYSTYEGNISISLYGTSDSNLVCNWKSDSVYRDYSAWYHVVVKWDNTQSAAADILKVYVNGEVVSGTFSTSPSNGTTTVVNKDFKQFLGKYVYGTQPNWWDGYMAEYHFIDGQSLTAASFGETNSDTNQWVPIEYEGAHGTQGWYLNFSDSSSLGADSSGNGNNFTANVLTATDQVLDSPTNNFATLNPLDPSSNHGTSTFKEGNLSIDLSGGDYKYSAVGNGAMSTGKWYFEFCAINSDNSQMLGVADITKGLNRGYTGTSGEGLYIYVDGDKYSPTSSSSYGVSWTYGDVMGIAVDMDNNAMYFAKNNTWMNSGDPTSGASKTGAAYTTELSGKTWVAAMGRGGFSNTNSGTFNFGQDSSFAAAKTAQGNQDGNNKGDFYYTPPTGYLALCEDNLSDPAIVLPTDHFNAILWSGNAAATRSFTGVGFSPDFVWSKNRTRGDVNHQLYDTVRGTGKAKALVSAETYSEDSGSNNLLNYGQLSSFDSDGFSVSDGSETPNWNFNNTTGGANSYVAWNWKADGTAVSNTDGTITSSVSANTTAGFSIVSYTGNGASGATIGHGLSQKPELVFKKNRSQSTNFVATTTIIDGGNDYVFLNLTNAFGNSAEGVPTSSVIPVYPNAENNSSGDNFICYAFHSVEGYSKIGSYTGNGSTDGTFVYTGFRPAFILWKSASASENWQIQDNKMNPYNVVDGKIFANNTASEYTGAEVDFVSNGFKLRHSGGGGNGSSETLVYLAIAESPFKYANAR